ncbi:MAG: SpoIID/LytB domain-containing protein [Oscillospiraceae bacterium]|nr:SpoIID/LytB domain-containing protein [Oscillospiraceae bacterium]
MKRFACLLLCAALLLLLLPQPYVKAAPEPNPLMRIGLTYGSNALAAANLQTHAGQGYEFGYINNDLIYISLGKTSEGKITVVKNRNVYLSGGVYSDTASDNAVGAFHTPHGTYPSREEAETAVQSLREEGTPAFVSYRSGSWLVRSSSFTDSGGGVRETGSSRCVSVVVTGTTEIIFQFDYGEAFDFCVRPIAPEGGAAVTLHRDYRYNGMFEFRRQDGNNITVINAVDMQEYVKGIVPYEMSPTWPVEALKAQAVCARSYTMANLNRHKSDGFNLCTTIHCHVYRGTSQASANSNRAVDETYGQYLLYNGQSCNTVYHSSDGGATENSENVWYEAVPYLRGVLDPYEDASKIIGNYSWSYTVTNAQLSAHLNQAGRANSGVSAFYIDRYTPTGNVYSVTVLDSGGGTLAIYTKESARTFLRGLVGAPANMSLSLRYSITSGNAMLSVLPADGNIRAYSDPGSLFVIGGDGNITSLPGSAMIISAGGVSGIPVGSNPTPGVYTVSGKGNGHNVGMSQWGARCMADLGMTYDHILRHYFTGVEITAVG